MPDTIGDIKGLPPEVLVKLQALNIKTTEDLLNRTETPSMRNALAKEIGVAASELTEWVNRADLMRLNGVGTEMANLLEEAGVDSVKELKHRRADHLYERMHELNEKTHIAYHSPSLKQLETWIDEAKTLSPM